MSGRMFMNFGLDGNKMIQRNFINQGISRPPYQVQGQGQIQSQGAARPGCNSFGASMFQRINVKTTGGGGGCGCGK
jgi:hypothetical protein